MLRRITLLILAAGVTLSGQVAAQKTDFLFSNRFYGAISAGLGVYFLTEANNARSDGNDAYERYEATGSSLLAREFYDESKQKDTKAAKARIWPTRAMSDATFKAPSVRPPK